MIIHQVEPGRRVVVWTGPLTPEIIERLRRIFAPEPITLVHGVTVR